MKHNKGDAKAPPPLPHYGMPCLHYVGRKQDGPHAFQKHFILRAPAGLAQIFRVRPGGIAPLLGAVGRGLIVNLRHIVRLGDRVRLVLRASS
jgi:hypothetical protein